MKTAKDIMTKKVWTLSPKEPIKKAINLMDKYGIKEIPILDSKNFVGMITYYDILDFVRLNPNEKISSLMIKPPTVEPNTSIEDTISLMMESGVEAVPVLKDNKLVGLISDYDILKTFSGSPKFKGLKIREFMQESKNLLKESNTISQARRIMRFNKIQKVPIVDDKGLLIGVVKSIDILKTFYEAPKKGIREGDKAGNSTNPLMMPVSNVITTNLPEVHPEDSVEKTLKEILNKNLKGVPVIDKEGRVVGVFERWDVLDKLVERKFKEGVWLNFSGFLLPLETVNTIRNYLQPNIKKMKIFCPDLRNINIHIKKLHGATPKKWNYEVKVQLIKKSGRSEIITNKEAWYGYNLMFTLQDSFNKLIYLLERKYKKKSRKYTKKSKQ